MFRLTHLMRIALDQPAPAGHRSAPAGMGPVVIWNLIRRCNLTCKHCYAVSADIDYAGELSTAEALKVVDDLATARVPVVILSGGEPLLRRDLFEIAARARERGLYVALSSNGTLIDEPLADRIAAAQFDYVGISLDGRRERHDAFRRRKGAYDASLHALRLCRDRGVKVGVRQTLTEANAEDLEAMLDLCETERFDKFYLSHLNYGGRGNIHKQLDAHLQTTRAAMASLFARAEDTVRTGRPLEIVTGNNDADGVLFLHWVRSQHPDRLDAVRQALRRWGGNASGTGIGNIDNLGLVHPDTFWWHHSVGNVRRRPFGEIWADRSDPVMAGLAQSPRPLEGRCRRCAYRDICNGNTRVRAFQATGRLWAEDPGCYLAEHEINSEALA